MTGLFYFILSVLLLLWVVGFVFAHVGPLIHLLLVVAGVVFCFQLLTGRRTV